MKPPRRGFVAPDGVPIAPDGLAAGAAALAKRHKVFRRIIKEAGLPRFARRAPGFGTLLHIILEQQVSIEAARAMHARLSGICAPLDPACFLALDDATLRLCGFSRQKTIYARGLAAAIADGRFVPALLETLDDEAALAALMALKGIGRWTAEVYCLFALGRPDIWPAADLGLQLAAQRLLGLAERPRTDALRAMGEAWRPWRSVAACLFWQWYLKELGRL